MSANMNPPTPEQADVASAARSCLVILVLLAFLVLIACAIIAVRLVS